MRNTRHRHLGDLSILVLDPEQLARPVTHIEVGTCTLPSPCPCDID